MDIDTPSSPPQEHQTTPTHQHIQPALPLNQPAAPPSSPDLLNSIHAPTLQKALQPKGAKRTSNQTDSNNPARQPLRLRPTPNMDTASKLEKARSLLEELYHTQGIDQQEAGQALIAIDNMRRACGYPHLGSSRDPWNSTASQQPTTTAIQSELNSLRQDIDQKFTTLANLLTSNSTHTGPSYAAALMQNIANQTPAQPTGKNNKPPPAKKWQPSKQTKDTSTLNPPTFHNRRLIIQPQSEIDPSTWRPIQHRDAFNQQLRQVGMEERIEVTAVTLSCSGTSFSQQWMDTLETTLLPAETTG